VHFNSVKKKQSLQHYFSHVLATLILNVNKTQLQEFKKAQGKKPVLILLQVFESGIIFSKKLNFSQYYFFV
jgi:hypothetical protein